MGCYYYGQKYVDNTMRLWNTWFECFGGHHGNHDNNLCECIQVFLLFDLGTGKVTLRKFIQNQPYNYNPLPRGWKIRPSTVFDEQKGFYECLEFLHRNHFMFKVDRGFRREVNPSFIQAVKTFRSTQAAFEEEDNKLTGMN